MKLQLAPFSLALRHPIRIGRGTCRERAGFCLRLENRDGCHGLGEATPLVEFGTEGLDETRVALEAAAEALSGEMAPRSIEDVERMIRSLRCLDGAPAARHGVELALLDLTARFAGLPLARLLANGVARSSVEVSALLDERTPAALARQAEAAAAAGFRSVKIKVRSEERRVGKECRL